MANQKDFDLVSLRAKDGPAKGDYYGLPWPCWGTPEMKHPGTHMLYNTHLHVKDGGGTFRARFGVQRVVKEKVMEDGKEVEKEVRHNLLAEGSYSVGSEIQDGYPEFTMAVLKKLGWDKDLTATELASIEKVGGNNIDAVSWATDLSGGIQRVCLEHGVIHYGNGKARAIALACPTRCRCTASRSTRRGWIWSRSIRRCLTAATSGCRTRASRSRSRTWRRGSASNSRSS